MATTTHTIDSEILDLERRYWQAMREQDVQTAVELTEFPCLIAGASGVRSVDQATYERMMTGGSWKIQAFEIEEGAKIRQLTDDVAVIAYGVREDMIVNGQPLKLHAFDSSVWVRRGDGWKCAMHSESVATGGDQEAAAA
jgi:hypothetical protein